MYLSHYDLNKKPFQISPNPSFLWMGEQYKEAMATFEYGIIDNRGLILLTGEIGTGKTTLINALIKRQPENTVIASITDPRMEKLDFYNFVAHSFNLNKKFQTKGDFLVHFSHFLHKSYAKDEKIILIIDEAQRLTHELLEEVRHLSNLEKEYSKLLIVILAGQKELNEVLNRDENRALRQRITLSYHLSALNKNDTADYIKHRIKISGGKCNIFKASALTVIHDFSEGYPRLINTICDHALLSGYVKGVKKIDGGIVQSCAKDFLLHGEQKKSTGTPPLTGLDDEERPVPAPESRGKKTVKSIVYICFSILILAGAAYYTYENRESIFNLLNQLTQSVTGKLKDKAVVPLPEKGGDIKNVEDKLKESRLQADKTELNGKNMAMPEYSGKKSVQPDGPLDSALEIAEKGGDIKNVEDKPKESRLQANKPELNGENMAMPEYSGKKSVQPGGPLDSDLEIEYVDEGYLAKAKRILPLKDGKLIIYFGLNSNEILGSAYDSLNLLADIMIEYPGMEIMIRGYSDSSGQPSFNKIISGFRAVVVKNYLVGKEADPSRIKVLGMGPATKGGQGYNKDDRRVEIEF